MATNQDYTPLSHIANLDAIIADELPSFKASEREQFNEADMAAAEGNLNKLNDVRAAIEGQLLSVDPSSEEAASLRAALSDINVGISDVAGAIRSRDPIALSTAATTSSAIINLSGGASTSASTKGSSMGISTAAIMYNMDQNEKAVYSFMSENNVGGFNDLNEASQLLITEEVNKYLDNNPEKREALEAAEDINNNPVVQEIETEVLENLPEDELYLRENIKDEEFLRKYEELKTTLKDNEQDMTLANKLADMHRKGASVEELEAEMDARQAEWQKMFDKHANDMLADFTPEQREQILKNVAESQGVPVSDVDPQDIQKHVTELKQSPPDPKHLNDAAYVMNVHGEDGWQYLSEEQKDAFISHKAMQIDEINKTIESTVILRDSLTPEQLERWKEAGVDEKMAIFEEAIASNPDANLQDHLTTLQSELDSVHSISHDNMLNTFAADEFDRDQYLDAMRIGSAANLFESETGTAITSENEALYEDKLLSHFGGDSYEYLDYGLGYNNFDFSSSGLATEPFIDFEEFIGDDSVEFGFEDVGVNLNEVAYGANSSETEVTQTPTETTETETQTTASASTNVQDNTPQNQGSGQDVSFTTMSDLSFDNVLTTDSVISYSGNVESFGVGGATPANVPDASEKERIAMYSV